MTNLLEVQALRKEYNNFVLSDISFSLPKGYIMGLIGPNGSGKTTTIKLILNMLYADGGMIKLFNKNNIQDEVAVKEDIGIVFDSSYFMDDWKVSMVEKVLKGFYRRWDSQKYHGYLKRFHLSADKKIKELSRGMQMKLMLACALSHDAKLLILDEPTSGLDPVARDELLEIFYDYIADGERSILFSTHITPDLEKIADFITFIVNGKLYYTGGKDEFVDNFRMIKGGREDVTKQQKKDLLIGYREYSSGFEGLIHTNSASQFPNMLVEPVSIDDIIVFVSKGDAEND